MLLAGIKLAIFLAIGSIRAAGMMFRQFGLVDQNSACWNPLLSWLRQLAALRRAA
jgi:hypothetical protein